MLGSALSCTADFHGGSEGIFFFSITDWSQIRYAAKDRDLFSMSDVVDGPTS
jgi:hypothetical protein